MSTPITITLLFLLLSISSTLVLAHFFSNFSSVPPWIFSTNATASAWDSFNKFSGCRSGDKVAGLSKLKHYFHDFGYMIASYTRADIKIGFYTGDHGDGEPFDGVLGTLAHAFSPPSGWFHLDGAENWVVSGDLTKLMSGTTAVDLESVAVHEIGHVLGLGHSSIPSAIMYPTISAGTRKVELVGDDVDGIQSLYGANPNYDTPSGTSSTQQSETNTYVGAAGVVGPSTWGVAALVAFGFGIMML